MVASTSTFSHFLLFIVRPLVSPDCVHCAIQNANVFSGKAAEFCLLAQFNRIKLINVDKRKTLSPTTGEHHKSLWSLNLEQWAQHIAISLFLPRYDDIINTRPLLLYFWHSIVLSLGESFAKLEWESRYFQHFCVRFVIPNNRLFRAFFINQLIFLLEWIQNVDVNHLDEVRCIGKCNWLCRCLRISSVPSSTNPNVILSHSQICLIFEIGMDSSCFLPPPSLLLLLLFCLSS